jgi:signal transduction histidine kinase
VATFVVVLAGVASVLAMALAAKAAPVSTVAMDPAHGEVGWVLPGSSSWQDGVRSGQRLVRLTYETGPSDWEFITADAAGTYTSRAQAHAESLRATTLHAAGACVLALLGILLVGRRRRLAGSVGVLALGLASIPIATTDQPAGSTIVIAAVPVVAAAWLTLGARTRLAEIGLIITLAVVTVWLAARLWWPAVYDATDAFRIVVVLTLMALVVAVAAPWRDWLLVTIRLDPSLTVDVGALVLVLAAASLALTLFAVPVWLAIPTAVGLLALYPRVRHRLGAALEQLILGDIRDHAAITATEEERARLAREIHDGPLQELAAVISDLDDAPEMAGAATLLREVAAELRGVTTALRPPVLDDLGLGAAVAWLVDQARLRGETAPHITCALEDHSEVGRAGRPPADVELAAFRIIQEALTNALTHAGATGIAVAGRIEPLSIDLQVTDDGRGIDDALVRNARRVGRLGLPSMRQRASAIGAELVVSNRSSGGASVAFSWDAR